MFNRYPRRDRWGKLTITLSCNSDLWRGARVRGVRARRQRLLTSFTTVGWPVGSSLFGRSAYITE